MEGLGVPVLPNSVLAAKAAAAMIVLTVSTVLPPMLVSIGVATGAYTGRPDLAPQVIGGIVPFVNELSPTSIGTWGMAVAKGQPASVWTLGAWIVSMIVLLVGAKSRSIVRNTSLPSQAGRLPGATDRFFVPPEVPLESVLALPSVSGLPRCFRPAAG